MSPDIEWHVGDDAEQETIAAATSPRRSRRSWIAILIVVVLGAGLGMAYRSIPEPTPRPTPTPSPTPWPSPTPPAMPVKLYAAIEREAQALADGDAQSYNALQMPREGQMADQPRDDIFQAWGRPIDDRPLFTIVDTNLSTMSKAWTEIRQFRHGRWFRTTRFYQFDSKEGRWLRADADPSFWSGQVATLDTPHLQIIYALEDRELIDPMAAQLEQSYATLCIDLDCATSDLTYTLQLNSEKNTGFPYSDDGREIRFPSPRVMGTYEDAAPIGSDGANLVWIMAWTMAQRAAYDQPFAFNEDRDGDALLWAVTAWATRRAVPSPDPLFEWMAVDAQTLLPLKDLWGNFTSENSVQKVSQSSVVIAFIEQEYGAPSVAKILKGMRTAQSFADVIKNGLGVPFTEFEQKWHTWVKTNFVTP